MARQKLLSAAPLVPSCLVLLSLLVGDGLAWQKTAVGDLATVIATGGGDQTEKNTLSSVKKEAAELGKNGNAVAEEEDEQLLLQLIEDTLLGDKAENSANEFNENMEKIKANVFHLVCNKMTTTFVHNKETAVQQKTLKNVVVGNIDTKIVELMESVCQTMHQDGLNASFSSKWTELVPQQQIHDVLSQFYEDNKFLENLKKAGNGGNDLKAKSKNPLKFDPLYQHRRNMRFRKIIDEIARKMVSGGEQQAEDDDDGHGGKLIDWVNTFNSRRLSSPSYIFERFRALWQIMEETNPQKINRRKRNCFLAKKSTWFVVFLLSIFVYHANHAGGFDIPHQLASITAPVFIFLCHLGLLAIVTTMRVMF